MDWLQTVFQNGPEVIRAASQSGLGIIALCLLIIGCAGVFYLARSNHSSPWIGFGVFVIMVVGAMSLSVVGLYAGAKQTLDLAHARQILFKTPHYDADTKVFTLLDATVTRMDNNTWRELQRRPEGTAEYYYELASIEPGRLLFNRRRNPSGPPDTTQLIVDTSQRLLCWRMNDSDPNLKCPYALVEIE